MSDVVVEIGQHPVRLSTDNPALLDRIRDRYGDFVTAAPCADPFHFAIQVVPELLPGGGEKLLVTYAEGRWRLGRDSFQAEWIPESGLGSIRQIGDYAYSIDAVLRIVHTLLLAPRGGFLLHASSAVRNGNAFVFSGVSGAGKTTISRLTPPDATLLTDEISYIRPRGDGYEACGTPFAGDWGKNGANISAPLKEIHMLAQGLENKRELLPAPEAARALLRNILFFAADPEYVRLVFESACRIASVVPVYRLTFVPTEEVWKMIS
jgi:hypothetical protein